jgi:hypothetical protein
MLAVGTCSTSFPDRAVNGGVGPEVLTVLGVARGSAKRSTFRRVFALVSADVLGRVLGAWLYTRAVQAGGLLMIAIDGETVRGAKARTEGPAPDRGPGTRHRRGPRQGRRGREAERYPRGVDLPKAFASLASAVITIEAMHTQHDTAQVISAG